MHLAKFKNSLTEAWNKVRADEYDPALHGMDLQCGDDTCVAPMHFRRGGRTHGQSFPRADHFVTMPKRDHREGCTLKTLLDESEADGQTFHDAIRDGKYIVINLNMDFGAALNVLFSHAGRFKSMDTEYGRFARNYKNQYVTRSVKSLAEMLEQVHAVEFLGGKEALGRVLVSHYQSLRPLSDVMIRHDENRLVKLYHDMFFGKERLAMMPDRVVGFPRLFHFVPTKNTRDAEDPKRLLGNSVITNQNDKSRLVLLQSLDTKDTSLRGRVREECEIYLLSCPVIRPHAARHATADFKAGKKDAAFIFMDWPVTSEAQFFTVPARERQTRQKPRPQPDLQHKLAL